MFDSMLGRAADTERAAQNRNGEQLFVWLVWVGMAMAAASIFLKYSSNVPFGDDWFQFVPYLSGKPANSGYFWEQLSENRIPLTKLLYVAIFKLTGNNLRCIILFSLATNICIAAGLLLALKKVRGRNRWTDAFIPLIWLHPGHVPAFTWASMSTMVISNALSAVLLMVCVRSQRRLSAIGGLIGGLCLAALPWCGGHGVLAAILVGCWFVPISFRAARIKVPVSGADWIRCLHFAIGVIGVGLIPLYFVGYRAADGTPVSPGISATLVAAFEYLATGFAPGSRVAWVFASSVTVCLIVLSISFLYTKSRQDAPERLRLLGLAAFIATALILALAVGVKRAGFGPGAGYAIRYVEYGSLLLSTLYVICTLYAPERLRALPGVFVLLMAVFMPVLAKNGLSIAESARLTAMRFERDARSGANFAVIASRYATGLQIPVDDFRDKLPGLQRARVAPFERILPVPPTEETHIPAIPSSLKDCSSTGDGAVNMTGRASGLVYRLPGRRFVTAIRITYTHQNVLHSLPAFEAYWKRSDQSEFVRHDWPNEQYYFFPFLPTGLTRHTTTIYINDTIDELFISPDRIPCRFSIAEVMVLTPAAR